MTIRRWWDGDSDERFWLEVTDRQDLGANLHAPQVDDAGREHWSYALVAEVAAGDVVLHWWKIPGVEPALVGFSYAVGDVQQNTIRWKAHGTAARAADAPVKTKRSWLMPLTEFTQFDTPITLARLRELEGELKGAKDATLAAHGEAAYFPFSFSEKRSMRTTQGYLMKFPVASLAAIPELASLFGDAGPAKPSPAGEKAPRTRPRRGVGGRQQDQEVRKAVERHAVEWTLAHLGGLGYDVLDVGDLGPFDILAIREADELHVEVKGSSTDAVTVELTDGEVKHSEAGCVRVLVVVDAIKWVQRAGKVTTSGGTARIWWEWVADDDALVPTRYRYTLPGDPDRP